MILAGLKNYFRLIYHVSTESTYLNNTGSCKEVIKFYNFIATRYSKSYIITLVMYFDTLSGFKSDIEPFEKYLMSNGTKNEFIHKQRYQMEYDGVT
jgi:hypothetical protein